MITQIIPIKLLDLISDFAEPCDLINLFFTCKKMYSYVELLPKNPSLYGINSTYQYIYNQKQPVCLKPILVKFTGDKFIDLFQISLDNKQLIKCPRINTINKQFLIWALSYRTESKYLSISKKNLDTTKITRLMIKAIQHHDVEIIKLLLNIGINFNNLFIIETLVETDDILLINTVFYDTRFNNNKYIKCMFNFAKIINKVSVIKYLQICGITECKLYNKNTTLFMAAATGNILRANYYSQLVNEFGQINKSLIVYIVRISILMNQPEVFSLFIKFCDLSEICKISVLDLIIEYGRLNMFKEYYDSSIFMNRFIINSIKYEHLPILQFLLNTFNVKINSDNKFIINYCVDFGKTLFVDYLLSVCEKRERQSCTNSALWHAGKTGNVFMVEWLKFRIDKMTLLNMM